MGDKKKAPRKPAPSARLQARSIVHWHLLETAAVCRQRADEVETVNRSVGFAHLCPEILRERAIAYEELAATIEPELLAYAKENA